MQPRSIRVTVEYDGADFAGFQRQVRRRTIQGELEGALGATVGHDVTLVGAGRTDAGVHARGQVVSMRVATRLDDSTLLRAWNARLPKDVVIRSVTTVAAGFHARRDAVGRTYEYRIIQSPHRPALDRDRGWFVRDQLDVARMHGAAQQFLGAHDFRAFTIGHETRTWREITEIAVWREADEVMVRVAGNAFLHRMVRRMVGTLARVGWGELNESDVRALLAPGPRAEAGPAAPPYGLTLIGVSYEELGSRSNMQRGVGEAVA